MAKQAVSGRLYFLREPLRRLREIWNFNNVDFPAANTDVLRIDWFSLFGSEFDIDNVYKT
jgi:hypothetical protein